MRKLNRLQCLVLTGVALLLTACSNGGNLNLEPGAKKGNNKNSAFVTVNQGGRALIVEQGQTATSGVHGYVTVQTVKASNLSGGQANIILNKAQAQANQ